MSRVDGVDGDEAPIRAFPPLPHQCRCIIGDEAGNENRCKMLVFDGPDAPVCEQCERDHWATDEILTRGLTRRMAPHGGPVTNYYEVVSEDE